MSAFKAVTFNKSKARFLRQGTLVTYTLPYASTLELTGRLKGIVISGDHYNRVNNRPCICPIMHGKTSINEAWGIPINSHNGVPCYLRPDLASFIGVHYGEVKPIPRSDTHRPCIFPAEIVRQAAEKFIDIIRPTPEKLAQRGRNFLAYGEMNWSNAVPRNNEKASDRAIIINLTSADIYEETGLALTARAYSHLEKFHPHWNIAIGADRWFDTGFFKIGDVKVTPVKGTLSSKSGCKSLQAGPRALKGFAKKSRGHLDAEAYAEIVARYTSPIGCLPPHIISASRKNTPAYHC